MGASIDHRRQSLPARPRDELLAHQHEERRRRQVDALALLDCLRDVPKPQIKRLAPLCTLRAFLADTVILNERTPGGFLFLILRGTVSLTLHDRVGQEVLIGVLNRGDCFGEGPLFGDLFRGATARAHTSCYLLQLPREDVRALLPDVPELAGALRAIYRQRLVQSTLGRMPLFGCLSTLERARIAALLRPQHHARGATIIREGEVGDALYLIEAGQVLIERGGQVIAHLDEGDFFGEMALLNDAPHNADVRTITPADVLALPADDFMRLLRQQPALAQQLSEVVEQRRSAGVAMQRDHQRAHQFSAAVERGLLRGSHLLVRDPQLCLDGCQVCADACTERHGRPRLQLNGLLLDGLDVADACRQCRVGPECVESCPEDAIRWNDRGALIITDSCTGCGECVSACPYQAVGMAARGDPVDTPLWSLWRQLRRLRHGTIRLEAVRSRQRADKCDLCAGHDDLACVSACPTGALRLVPVKELFPL